MRVFKKILFCTVSLILLSGCQDVSTTDEIPPPTQTVQIAPTIENTQVPVFNSFEEIQRLGYGALTELEISPDGQLLAVATATGFQVYGLMTQTKLFESKDAWCTDLDWSYDSKKIIAAFKNNTLEIWDVTKFNKLTTIDTTDAPQTYVSWSPAGDYFATSEYKITKIWDSSSFTLVKQIDTSSQYLTRMEWTSNGNGLVYNSGSPGMTLLDIETGKVVSRDDNIHALLLEEDRYVNGWNTAGVVSVMYANQDERLFVGGEFSKPLYRVEGNKVLHVTGSLMQYDFTTGENEILFPYDWHRFSEIMDWNSELTIFVSGGIYGNIEIVSLPDGETIGKIPGYYSYFDNLSWSPDNERLSVSMYRHYDNVFSWDLSMNNLIPRKRKTYIWGVYDREYEDGILAGSMVWVDPEHFLVSGEYFHNLEIQLMVWDGVTGDELINEIIGNDEKHILITTKISPDGNYLLYATSSFSNTDFDLISVIEITSKKTIFSSELSRYSESSATWSLDSRFLALSDTIKETISIWDVLENRLISEWTVVLEPDDEKSNNILEDSMSWSNDNKYLAARSRDGKLWVWEIATGKEVFTSLGIDELQSSISFLSAWSPNRPYLIYNNLETLHIINIETLEKIASQTGFYESIQALVWSPDGSMIATIGEDSTIRIWQAP